VSCVGHGPIGDGNSTTYDMVCPISAAHSLHESEFVVVPNAGTRRHGDSCRGIALSLCALFFLPVFDFSTYEETIMFDSHTLLLLKSLLLLLLLVLCALICYYVPRMLAGFRKLDEYSSSSAVNDQAWRDLGEVQRRIAQLKDQFDSLSGRKEAWEDTVGAHIRNAVVCLRQFKPLQALANYRFAEELALDCVSRMASGQASVE
jgi:hypothetical protein